MDRLRGWWKSEAGSAVRAGLATALCMSAGLVLVARMASEAGAYFPAVYVIAAAISALGTLALGRLGTAVALGPDLMTAGWLFALLVISHGLTLGQLYALLAIVAFLVCMAAFTGVASRIVRAIPLCIRQALPLALGAMMVLWGCERGRLLLASPVHLVMLGDFADPLAYFSLLGIVVMLGLCAMKFYAGDAQQTPPPLGEGDREAVERVTHSRDSRFYRKDRESHQTSPSPPRMRSAPPPEGEALGKCVGLGLLVTAALSFVEGFWIIPPAPFYAPEGLDRSVGLFLLAGEGDAKAFATMIATLPWLFLVMILNFWGTWQALGTSNVIGANGTPGMQRRDENAEPSLPPKRPLCLAAAMNLLAALCGMTPMTAAPESAMAGEAGRAQLRAYAAGAAAGLLVLMCAAPLAKELASFPAMLVPCVVVAGLFLLLRTQLVWSAFDLAERTAVVVLVVIVPLTYDMVLGLSIATVAYVLLKVLSNRTEDITCTMRILAAFVVLIVFFDAWLF